MKKLILVMMLSPFVSYGQKFYVDGKDNKSRDYVISKVKFEGFNTTEDSTKSDFTLQLLTDGAYKVVSFKRPYKGYIRLVNSKSGEEIGRTELVKGSPTAFNGYNASYAIYSKISDKQLPKLLKKIN